MSYEDRKAIGDMYNNTLRHPFSIETYEDVSRKNAEETKAKYGTTYPFPVKEYSKGRLYVDTWYLWEMSECKMKSMYFGKYWNENYKKDIKEALEKGEAITKTARTSYDVRFSYNPDTKMAWYSEEYKDCGNGHYYIAIDHNTAWFCEDD